MAGGEVVIETFDSKVLRGNPLGDPTKRDVTVYLPPKYDRTRRYPAAYAIVGYTGTGKSPLSVDPLGEDLKSKLDRLIRTGKMGPMIVPMVDCFTKVGGNQYINSTATGRYDDYLRKEIVPFVESRYPVSRRGIWGKSSGGYGSIVQGMLHPDTWWAVAAVGSGEHGGPLRAELAAHAPRVHRLRDERPVQPDLGRAGDPPEAPRAAHQARVRGVRRHALFHHVPIRRQPSADVPRAPRVGGPPIRDDGRGPASSGRTAH